MTGLGANAFSLFTRGRIAMTNILAIIAAGAMGGAIARPRLHPDPFGSRR
jgi:hypothetical protein